MTDEYEIIPRKEIQELKKEIQELKSHLGTPVDSDSGETTTLIQAIKELTAIFKEAIEEFKKEPAGQVGETQEKQLTSDKTKVDVLIEQNEKIARGILALADILNEHLPQISKNTAQQPKVRYIRIPVPPQSTPQQTPQYQQLWPRQGPQQGGLQQGYPKTQPIRTPQINQQVSQQVIPQPNQVIQSTAQPTQQPNQQPQQTNQQLTKNQGLKPKPMPKHDIKF